MNNGPILLVEDNPDDVELTLRAFDRNNLANRVLVARDGQEALDLLLGARQPELGVSALVLLDLKLPKVSGLDVLARLRAEPRLRRLPVIVLTTSDHDRDVAAAYDAGANSYVRKPVDFTQFISAVQTLGLYWLVINISV